MRLLIFMIFLTVGSVHADSAVAPVKLKVFKSKTCGCCVKWIDQLNEKVLMRLELNLDQLGSFKSSKGIARYQSFTQRCRGGFVFEAIYPPDITILDNPIEGSISLAVPGSLLKRAWVDRFDYDVFL